MASSVGTGKTYTAFQIIWRLWKSGSKRRILFLADRNILVDQTKNNDFKPFGAAMTKIGKRQIDKSYEIYLCLYHLAYCLNFRNHFLTKLLRIFLAVIIVQRNVVILVCRERS